MPKFQLPLPDAAAFDKLQKELLDEAALSHDDGARFTFDKGALRVGIDYPYKEFIDRFPKGKLEIQRLTKKSPNDKRTLQETFRDELGSPETKKAYADQHVARYDKMRDNGYKKPETEPKIDTAPDAMKGTEEVMKSQPGMCLDDDHGSPDQKDFLIKNMADLKGKAGIDTLFIEHFWGEQQGMLDAYINGPDDGELDPVLAEAVRKLDDRTNFKGRPMFAELLKAARTAKMRVVGIDDFEAKVEEDNPRFGEERAARFNSTAADTIASKKGPGKFLVLAGKKHNNTHTGGVPGMSQLLGVPTYGLAGGKLARSPENEKLRGMRSKGAQTFYDAFYDEMVRLNPARDKHELMALAEELSKKYGPTVEAFSPAALLKLVQQRAAEAQKIATAKPNATAKEMEAGATAESAALKKARTDLEAAIKAGKTADVQNILATNDDPRLLTVDTKGLSLISKAVSGGQLDIVKALAGGGYLASVCISPGGRSLLHEAVQAGNLAIAKYLVEDCGMNPADYADDAGNTALHEIAKCPKAVDPGDVAEYLVQKGLSMSATNQKGQNALHGAALGGKPECMKKFAANKGEFDKANVPDGRGWMPIDVASSAGQTGVEDYLFGANLADDSALVSDDYSGPPLNTVDVLCKATLIDPEIKPGEKIHDAIERSKKEVRAHFEELYRDPAFRPILDAAAADALGSRKDAKKALRLFITLNSDFAGDITGKGGYGAFDDKSNTIAFGGKRSLKDLRGTIIHELTHHAAEMAYGKAAVPYDDENSPEAIAYREAIEKDVKMEHHHMSGPEAEVSKVVTKRIVADYGKGRNPSQFRVAALQEMLVGIPQTISSHGEGMVEKVAPNLLAFYKGDFANICTNTANKNTVFKDKIQKANTTYATTLAPIPPPTVPPPTWMKDGPPDKGGFGGRLGLMDNVMLEYRARHGKPAPYSDPALQGIPTLVTQGSGLQVPEDSDDKIRHPKEDAIKEIIGQMLAEFPPELSEKAYLKFLEEAGDAVHSSTDLGQLRGAIAKKGREMIRTAKIDYLQRAKDTGKLTPDLVAETVIYEAACQALENDPSRNIRDEGAAPDLKDKKIRELMAQMTSSMTAEQMKKLADPVALKAMATSLTGSTTSGKVIKTTKQKGFYTKRVRRRAKAGHVSLKTNEAKRTWLTELAKL